MGAGGGGPNPKKEQRKIFINNELNRQMLLAQLAGLRSQSVLRAPAAAATGTTLLRSGG